jgi:hypothetical protein
MSVSQYGGVIYAGMSTATVRRDTSVVCVPAGQFYTHRCAAMTHPTCCIALRNSTTD